MASAAPSVLAIIPVRGKDAEGSDGPVMLAAKPLIAYTIEAAKSCSLVTRLVVSTDSPSVQQLAIELGAEAPFVRPADLAAPGVTLDRVLQHCLEWMVDNAAFAPDIVVTLEVAHPLRPVGLIEQVVGSIVEQGLDTVFAAFEEHHAFWAPDDHGELRRVGTQESTTRDALMPLYREMAGLAVATRGAVLRDLGRFGERIGVVPLRDPATAVDTQDPAGLLLAEVFMSKEPPRS